MLPTSRALVYQVKGCSVFLSPLSQTDQKLRFEQRTTRRAAHRWSVPLRMEDEARAHTLMPARLHTSRSDALHLTSLDSGAQEGAAAVAEFVQILDEHRKTCEREGKYIEADIAKKRLEELRQHEDNRKQEGLRSRQIAQRLGVEEAHMLEFQQARPALHPVLSSLPYALVDALLLRPPSTPSARSSTRCGTTR